MPQQKIILEIKEDGTVSYEVQGVKGNLCTAKTGWLDKLLGTVKKRTFKKEYHSPEMVQEWTR
jgi:hypothetical protein